MTPPNQPTRPTRYVPSVNQEARGSSLPTALRFSLPFATLGLALGVLAAVGWRYTVPRLLFDTAPPQLPTGKIGYMFVVNSLEWVTGPAWWPTFALLPATGLATGLIVGILVARFEEAAVPAFGPPQRCWGAASSVRSQVWQARCLLLKCWRLAASNMAGSYRACLPR